MKKILLTLLLLILTACTAIESEKSSKWELSADDGRSQTYIYSDSLQLTGWLEYVPRYIGPETAPHFKVSKSSTPFLPKSYVDKSEHLFIDQADFETYKTQLESSSEDSPITIELSKLIFSSEGTPKIGAIKSVTP